MMETAPSQLSPAAPEATSAVGAVPKFLAILAQLALILAVIWSYQLEHRYHFAEVFAVIAVGFALHAFAPAGLRKPIVVLTCWAAIFVSLGIIYSVAIVLLVLAMIGLFRLPAELWMRAALMILLLIVLAVARGDRFTAIERLSPEGQIHSEWVKGGNGINDMSEFLEDSFCSIPAVRATEPHDHSAMGTLINRIRDSLVHNSDLFPAILGSILMFRLAYMLFDVFQTKREPTTQELLSYFFMPPHAAFTAFPIIDFRTWRLSYYDAEAFKIYQTGVSWIVQGLIHLLLYRVIRYYFLPDVMGLDTLWLVFVFLVANFATYLHFSGWFHLIIGMLQLFGYNLPRSHDKYFLATSFTDIWRRINIYWKDFMSKVVFMPAFFRLRALGEPIAIFLCVGLVFFVTWVLHIWQMYWIIGRDDITGEVAGLWMGLGLVVAINAILDYRKAAQRKPKKAEPQSTGGLLLQSARLGVQNVAMFMLISLFWVCWGRRGFLSLNVMPKFFVFEDTMSPKWAEASWSPDPNVSGDLIKIGVTLLIACAVVAALRFVVAMIYQSGWRAPKLNFAQSAAANAALLLLAMVMTVPAVVDIFGKERAPEILAFQRETQTASEAREYLSNYYDKMLGADYQQVVYSGVRSKRDLLPQAWDNHYRNMTFPRRDILQTELIPSWEGEIMRRNVKINKLGMRDVDRTMKKPAGVCRIAFVGNSNLMGFGVGDQDTLTQVMERKLNESRGPGEPRYEVLNFGIGKYYPLQKTYYIDVKVLNFEPDAIFYMIDQSETLFFGQQMPLDRDLMLSRGVKIPYEFMEKELRGITIGGNANPLAMFGTIGPVVERTLPQLYEHIVKECKARNVKPVFVAAPIPLGNVKVPGGDYTQKVLGFAEKAGFITLDITGFEGDHDMLEIHTSPEEPHLKELGHKLIAEAILEKLKEKPEALPDCSGAKK